MGRFRTIAACLLCAVSLCAMLGDILDWPKLKGLATATTVAPLPKVFSDVRGLETFASTFTFEITSPGEPTRSIAITPELYGRLAGPYNRRNVFGAALAYAPRLPDALWQAVFCYALRPGGPLRAELGLSSNAQARIAVVITTRTDGRSDTWRLDPECSK